MNDVERRSHKRLDPDIKAMRAIDRALAELPDDAHRRRVMEWTVARGLGRTWIMLPRFRWRTCVDERADRQAYGEVA